nr:hypothetical protein [Desulfobacterales bacterium]
MMNAITVLLKLLIQAILPLLLAGVQKGNPAQGINVRMIMNKILPIHCVYITRVGIVGRP